MYYHGGYPGLKPGDVLLPPAQRPKALTLSEFAGDLTTNQEILRRDVVYMTTTVEAATMFAMFYPGGGLVYQVEPVGLLSPDPDCSEPGLSWRSPSARVVEIVQEVNR